MQDFLQNIDQFGVEQKLQIRAQNPVEKSIFGGVMTLILYGASFAYFLTEFIDYVQNNKLPKITQYSKSIAYSETVESSERVFEIYSLQWAEGDLDPFDPQNLTFYPYVTQIVGNLKNRTKIPISFEQVKQKNGKLKNIFYLKQQQIVASPLNGQDFGFFIDHEVALGMCNQTLIPEGFKCADDSRNQQYFKQINYFTLVMMITGYDTKKKELYEIPKYYELRVSEDSGDFYQINLKLSDTQTDDGFLFNDYHKLPFISDYSVRTHKINLQQTAQQFGQITPIQLMISLDPIKDDVQIEYQKVSELLANTGSIISWIFQISFIVLKYNQRNFTDKTIKEIIQLYYPDLQNFTIDRNLLGRYLSVGVKDKKYDPNKVGLLLRQLSDMAMQKANFINLQYEVSRLQFALRETLGLSNLKQPSQEKKLETLIDNLGYRIEQPAEISSTNIKHQSSINKQLFSSDSIDHDQIKPLNTFGQDTIQSTMGLLYLQTQQVIPKQKTNEIEKMVYPKEQLCCEEISHSGSKDDAE